MKRLLCTLALLITLTTTQAQDTGATLTIDAIELDAPIVESTIDRQAEWMVPTEHAIGRLVGTAQLGAGGNVGLAGHFDLEDGSAGVFARLNELETGDIMTLTLEDGTERDYVVTATYVTNVQDLTPLYPTTEDRLTLITCHTYDPTNSTYTERLIVIAERGQEWTRLSPILRQMTAR